MKPRISEQGSQVLVALSIVGAMAVIAVGLIVAGIWTKNWALTMSGLGPIVGALATALNTPTGVSAALSAAKPSPADPPAQDPQQ